MKPSQNINISVLSFDQKVEKSKAVIKEVMELYGSEHMALAITGGKDSTTNLWLFKEMCEEYGLKLPLCMFIDEGDVFDEIREFVDFLKVRWNLEITLVKNRDPILRDAPDLYILAEPGFDLKAAVNQDSVFGRSQFRGAHTYTDAHLFISNKEMFVGSPDMSIESVPHLIKFYLR